MSSKFAFGWLIVLAVCVALWPRAGECAQWNVSPYRAQLASADPAGQTDAEAAAADSAKFATENPLKRNIGKAALFSLMIPGTGELYAGSWIRALPFFAAEVAGWAYFATYHAKGNTKTNDFQNYAGWRDTPNHYNVNAYMWAEYSVAIDSLKNGGRPTFHGDFGDVNTPGSYMALWDDWDNDAQGRFNYLPPPFTHDIFTSDQQQYYEMIGKYIGQFGFGWQDTYNGGAGWNGSADWTRPGTDPSGHTLTADDPSTVTFDGNSWMFYHYRDMRGLANAYYNKGNVAMEVVLVNHILSALDAAFAVRAANKHLASTETPKVGHINFHYDAKLVNGSLTRFVTATVPLN